jgi:hypothetical protein
MCLSCKTHSSTISYFWYFAMYLISCMELWRSSALCVVVEQNWYTPVDCGSFYYYSWNVLLVLWRGSNLFITTSTSTSSTEWVVNVLVHVGSFLTVANLWGCLHYVISPLELWDALSICTTARTLGAAAAVNFRRSSSSAGIVVADDSGGQLCKCGTYMFKSK